MNVVSWILSATPRSATPLVVLVLACHALSSASLAEQRAGVCLGYHSEMQVWGEQWIGRNSRKPDKDGRYVRHCPENHVFYAVDDPSVTTTQRLLIANCCPLPFDDILSTEHTSAPAKCPSDSVITGVEYIDQEGMITLNVRCTKINNQTYQLAAPKSGVYWGVGRNMNTLVETKKIKRGEIPAAIRSSVGRTTRYLWDDDGCIGAPIGSLLVGLGKSTCKQFTFSQLLHKDERPVQLFEDCVGISDVFDPNARCIQRDE